LRPDGAVAAVHGRSIRRGLPSISEVSGMIVLDSQMTADLPVNVDRG
jgi:hypothetical protein